MSEGNGTRPPLPPGWAWATLGEIAPLEYGKSLPERKRDPSGDVAVFGSAGKVGTHTVPLVDEACIVVGRKGSAGSVYFSDEPSWTIDTAYFSVARDGIDKRFAYWLLKSKRLGDLDQSTAIPSLSRDIYNAVHVGVPSINEQRRIADRIQELFGEIEAGEQELEKAREGLETYRRSILKAAVTGELTKEWRKKNALSETGADLLARILKERRAAWEKAERAKIKAKGKTHKSDDWKKRYQEPKRPDAASLPKLPQGWVWACLDQLFTDIAAGQNFKCEGRPPEGHERGLVKISAVTYGVFDENESKAIPKDMTIPGGTRIRVGDFLFSRANTLELVGAPAIVRSVSKKLYLSDKVLRFCFAVPLEDWTYFVLRSPWGRSEIRSRATGAQLSMRNITQESIRAIRIPLPPENEIAEAVSILVNSFDAEATLDEDLRSWSRTVKALRQSILSAAFAGKLVPQDPNDEPASVLLEWLRAAKAATPAKRRGGRPRTDQSTAKPSRRRSGKTQLQDRPQ